MLSVAELDNAPVRRPHDFQRHPKSGAPFVSHPTETTKHAGLKADLIVECAKAGIAVPDKVTVAQLQALLGPRPKMVQYGRPSGLGKQIENMTAIQKWAERAVALGCFLEASLMKPLDALEPEQWNLDDDETRDVLDTIAVRAKDTAQAMLAAARGTHTHAITDDRDSDRDWVHRIRDGEDLGLPYDVQVALVAAWDTMLATYELTILASEATCVDDTWRQAGTLDCIARLGRDLTFILASGEMVTIPAGTVIVLDKKTGRLRLDHGGFVSWWQSYSVQVASYAQSVPYDADTDTRGEWGFEIDQRWAVIAHLDVLAALDGAATCRLVLVDLEAGRHAGAMCVAAREWESRRDVFSIVTDDLVVTVPVISDVVPNATPDAGTVQVDAPAVPAPSLAHEIAGWPDDVKARLAAVWPTGVATPRAVREHAAQWNVDDLAAIRQVFTEASAPFTDNDRTLDTPHTVAVPADEPPVAVDDGGPLDPAALDALLAACSADDTRATINTWMRQSFDADCYWNPRIVGTVRSFEQARAARALATMWDESGGDEIVRLIIEHALGAIVAEFPVVPIGVAIGALTIDEARAVVDVIDAVNSDRLTLHYSDDGVPRLVA